MHKKKSIRFILISIFAAGFIIYNGCGSDTPTTPVATTITVNGKVVDLIGNGVSNVTVIIGSSTTVSAADGSFTISSVTTPYSLKLVQTTSTPTGIKYDGLTTASPNIFALGLISSPNSATLTVNIPPLGINQRARVIFTDELLIERTGSIGFPSTSTTFEVQWPGSSTITGKVIVLIYTESGISITTYDNYGVKSGYALNNGGTSITTFAAPDLTTNPGETNVSGNIVAPAGYTNTSSTLILSFKSGGSNVIFGVNSFANTLGGSFTYPVPTGLSTAFKIFIRGSSEGTAVGSFTYKSLEVQPGSSGTSLNLDETSILSSPANGSTGIDTNTTFVFSPGTGSGVYLVTFSAAGQTFGVVSTSTTVTIPNFSGNGLGIGSSVAYTWYVNKLGNMSTTDAFVSSGLMNNANFNSISQSDTRTFTSAP